MLKQNTLTFQASCVYEKSQTFCQMYNKSPKYLKWSNVIITTKKDEYLATGKKAEKNYLKSSEKKVFTVNVHTCKLNFGKALTEKSTYVWMPRKWRKPVFWLSLFI